MLQSIYMTEHNCSNCEHKMSRGLLTGDSHHWIPADSAMGKLSSFLNFGLNTKKVWAWHCDNCQKIDFFTE